MPVGLSLGIAKVQNASSSWTWLEECHCYEDLLVRQTHRQEHIQAMLHAKEVEGGILESFTASLIVAYLAS